MKTGIVTFHSAYNFGASLQTWALQTVLERLGVQPFIVNYRPAVIDNLYNPLVGETGLRKYAAYRKLSEPRIILRHKRYEAFMKSKYRLLGEYHTYEELQTANINLDACISGSDQVWNVQHTGGYDPAYFLQFLRDGVKKISYAASIGTDYILPVYHEQFRGGLEQFDCISVREVSAVPVLSHLTDKEIDVVLDPTLLLDREDYEPLKVPVKRNEKYILVYMMEYNVEIVRYANYISRLLGIPIIQRRDQNYFTNELESMYTATPGEFLDYMEHAELVITNSFHGTVFSIIYEKPFVSMLHSDTGSRTADLLRILNLTGHLLDGNQERPGLECFAFENKEETRKMIHKLREHSMTFLRESLLG